MRAIEREHQAIGDVFTAQTGFSSQVLMKRKKKAKQKKTPIILQLRLAVWARAIWFLHSCSKWGLLAVLSCASEMLCYTKWACINGALFLFFFLLNILRAAFSETHSENLYVFHSVVCLYFYVYVFYCLGLFLLQDRLSSVFLLFKLGFAVFTCLPFISLSFCCTNKGSCHTWFWS